MTRCELTELLTDQCAHCRPTPPPEPVAEPATLTAKYPGTCRACWEPIEPDDQIASRYDPDEAGWVYLCKECAT